MNGSMNASVASQKTGRELHRKVFEMIKNWNGEYLVNVCETSILET